MKLWEINLNKEMKERQVLLHRNEQQIFFLLFIAYRPRTSVAVCTLYLHFCNIFIGNTEYFEINVHLSPLSYITKNVYKFIVYILEV